MFGTPGSYFLSSPENSAPTLAKYKIWVTENNHSNVHILAGMHIRNEYVLINTHLSLRWGLLTFHTLPFVHVIVRLLESMLDA